MARIPRPIPHAGYPQFRGRCQGAGPGVRWRRPVRSGLQPSSMPVPGESGRIEDRARQGSVGVSRRVTSRSMCVLITALGVW